LTTPDGTAGERVMTPVDIAMMPFILRTTKPA